MSKRGETYHTPPKQFRVPADLAPLQGQATMLVNTMRATHTFRMTEGARSIGTGRSVQSKRNKPGRKKG